MAEVLTAPLALKIFPQEPRPLSRTQIRIEPNEVLDSFPRLREISDATLAALNGGHLSLERPDEIFP